MIFEECQRSVRTRDHCQFPFSRVYQLREDCFLKQIIKLQVHTDENECQNSFPGIFK